MIAAQHTDTDYKTGYVQGVAPGAKILTLDFIDSGQGGSLSDAVEAVDYAIAAGANIINASWGGSACSSTLSKRILSLAEKNILFVLETPLFSERL